jgi:hypothetical protein
MAKPSSAILMNTRINNERKQEQTSYMRVLHKTTMKAITIHLYALNWLSFCIRLTWLDSSVSRSVLSVCARGLRTACSRAASTTWSMRVYGSQVAIACSGGILDRWACVCVVSATHIDDHNICTYFADENQRVLESSFPILETKVRTDEALRLMIL